MPVWRGVLNLLLALARFLPSPGLWAGVGLAIVTSRVAIEYADGLVPLTLVVDSVPQLVRTQRATVGEVLDDMGVVVSDWDRVYPPRHAAIQRRMQVTVQHARAVTLFADGTRRTVYTHVQDAQAILAEVGVALKDGDQLWVNGLLAGESRVPGHALVSIDRVRPASLVRGPPTAPADAASPASHIEVRRAIQVQVHDGGLPQVIRTTAATLGSALSESGMVLYLGDRVYPDLNTPLQTGLEVRIERGVPVSVAVDGRTLRTRTHSETIGQVLAELGVSLVGKDSVVPDPGERVQAGLEIRVSRITERQVIEEEEIPFETEWVSDASLEIDQRRVDASGANGVKRRRYRAVYQDGIEVERRLEDEWIAREPQLRQIAYGTKIVVRTLETPNGPIEYWRRIPVFLTSYTEETCGKTPDNPWYGLTRLGWRMRTGIIAVDPKVIPLLSELYVPGYGRGTAADTGGLIVGRHIDLGYSVDEFYWWFEWGDVYVLTPVPSPSRIRWVLPDFPRGRYW